MIERFYQWLESDMGEGFIIGVIAMLIVNAWVLTFLALVL